MATIIGEIRTFVGLLGSVGSFRRRRTVFLERRAHFDAVLSEVISNLAGVRRVWSEDHHRFDWRGWLHSDLLSTKAWRERKMALLSRVDSGPAISDQLAASLDMLYDEFDAARTSSAYSSDWERRLVDVATRLDAELHAFSSRRLNRILGLRSALPPRREIDREIRTPQTPADLQLRALAQFPESTP